MTDEPDETTDAQPTNNVENNEHPTIAESLEAGYLASDQEDTGTLVVIARIGKTAAEHEVASAGETVAELNPSYPEDDPVVFCTYRNALDSHFGDKWTQYPAEYLAFSVGDQGVPVYSFPISRLTTKDDGGDDGV